MMRREKVKAALTMEERSQALAEGEVMRELCSGLVALLAAFSVWLVALAF